MAGGGGTQSAAYIYLVVAPFQAKNALMYAVVGSEDAVLWPRALFFCFKGHLAGQD